jgi:hypothetical protein
MNKPVIRDFYEDLHYDQWTRDEFTAHHFRNVREYLERVERDYLNADVDTFTLKYATLVIDQATSLISDLVDIVGDKR